MTSALPAPTGPYIVGSRHIFLTDTGRSDPFSGAATRQVTLNAWYPTLGTGIYSKYLSDNTSRDQTLAVDDAEGFDGTWNYLFNPSSTMYPKIHAMNTWGIDNAAPRTDLGALPVVVFSPGFGVPGAFYSITAANLASNGFVVLVLSDTWEGIAVETATGVATQNVGAVNNQWQKCLAARTGDFEYVLNQLPTLPNGLGAVIDTTRIGGAGHSYGGYTAMQCAFSDTRIKSVLVLDGTCGWPGTTSSCQTGGMPNHQPVLLFAADPAIEKPSAAEHASWTGFEAQHHGPLWVTHMTGAAHYAMSDVCVVDPNTTTFSGTIAAARAAAIVPAYATDFFDFTLRGGPGTLTTGPSASYPEVTFVITDPSGA